MQQKTAKLEKMVRDMHVELNVKKQSLKKAIRDSEKKEMEMRKMKEKVSALKKQIAEMEEEQEGKKSDSESESESDSEEKEESKEKGNSKDHVDLKKKDANWLRKELRKHMMKKKIWKRAIEEYELIESTIYNADIHGGSSRGKRLCILHAQVERSLQNIMSILKQSMQRVRKALTRMRALATRSPRNSCRPWRATAY